MGNRGKGCCSSILGGDGGVEKKTGSGRTQAPSSQRHGRGELLGEGDDRGAVCLILEGPN